MAGGHGGRRPGSGRKPKDADVRALDGNAGHRGRVLPHPSAPAVAPPAPALDEADAPDDLTMDERREWLRWAPEAIRKGTLKGHEYAFILLCRNIVLEKALRLTEPASANHRGMIQRVDAELGDFGLRAFGKPSAGEAAQAAVDPMKAKYFGNR
jgi:hypothetical protein